MSWIKKLLKKIMSASVSLMLVLFFSLISIIAGSYLIISIIGYQNVTSADIVLGADRNTHRKILSDDDRSCADYSDTLQLHPYFSATHNNCFKLNELQLLGSQLDWENKNLHRVGIFGGSVASQFASFYGEGYFEELLNQCIIAKGSDVEFSVLNFADGSWKHPSQSIGLTLYGDYIDTAISIEGFNEHYLISANIDLAQPSSNFGVAARHQNTRFRLKLVDNIFGFFADTRFENSSFTKLLLLATRTFLINSIEITEDGIDEDIPLEEMVTFKPASVENIDRYKSFVRSFLDIANGKGLPALVVLQPAPIYKTLTDEEKMYVKNLSYRKQYEQLRTATLISPKFIDLSDMFNGYSESIFMDDIHFLHSPREGKTIHGRSLGDKMLSKRVIFEMLKLYPETFKMKDTCSNIFESHN